MAHPHNFVTFKNHRTKPFTLLILDIQQPIQVTGIQFNPLLATYTVVLCKLDATFAQCFKPIFVYSSFTDI